jgi:thiol-disulfide isomerase/thioredoxin
VLLLAAVPATGCIFGSNGTYGPAPAFNLVSLAGNPLNLSTYRGQTLVVDFMFTTCDPCKAMDPVLAKLKDTTGVRILSISTVNLESEATALRHGWNQSWDRALDTDQVFYRYGGKVIPYVVVVDGNGTIRAESSGETSYSTLASMVAQSRSASA